MNASTSYFRSTYPKKSLKKLKKNLKNEELKDYFDQGLMYYDKHAEYELFIFRHYEKNEWGLFFLINDKVQFTTIKTEERHMINCSLDSDKICILSSRGNIFEIYLDDMNITKFDIDIKDGISYEFDDYELKSESKIYMANKENFIEYDYKTNKYKVYINNDKSIYEINKFTAYNDGFIMICTENKTYKMMIKYYDDKFNLISTKYPQFNNEAGRIYIRSNEKRFSIINNKLFGIMQVDGKKIDEIVVLDLETAELLYQLEIKHKGNGVLMTDYIFFEETTK